MQYTKVPILKEVNFGKMKLCRVEHFWTYLSSPMGVIAEYNSNHAHWWGQICPKVFNSTEFHFSEVYFLQNWYFTWTIQVYILYFKKQLVEIFVNKIFIELFEQILQAFRIGMIDMSELDLKNIGEILKWENSALTLQLYRL